MFITGCVTKYIPDIKEEKNLLVVDGLITDRPEPYRINLSISQPIGEKVSQNPLTGAQVNVTDDAGNTFFFSEKTTGSYESDPGLFRGIIGRKYTLHIRTNSGAAKSYSYESYPTELKSVPPIDNVYYEKVFTGVNEYNKPVEGAQIYLDTHDSEDGCHYYRWNYEETWKFALHWDVPNQICWRTENSYVINLKSTTTLAENRISKYPLLFIDNSTDRLSEEYSILVSQYSLNQDEYDYWDKIQSVTENVGGLYDIVPASITGNLFCVEEPGQAVLGYFSVSSVSESRIFIKDHFSGQKNFYANCIGDTIPGGTQIPGLGTYTWILYVHQLNPTYTVVTYSQGCADCTTRGTTTKPSFWPDK